MPYLVKKVGGLALVLLGGLAIVHGLIAEQTWEILPGLILMVLGAALLGAKILGRNRLPADGKR